MRSLLIVYSYHHKNTQKVARAMADVLDAPVQTPQQTVVEDLGDYDLIGFGSGIYSAKHHRSVLELVEKLPPMSSQKAFIFSTTGAPAIGFTEAFVAKNHTALRERLQAKGYRVIDEFSCLGFNTNSFLRFFGGLNKGRPNEEDLDRARTFALNLQQAILDA